MIIERKVLTCGSPTQNSRVYPSHLMELAVKKYKEEYIDKGKAWGEFQDNNSESGFTLNMDRISHQVKDLYFVGLHLIARIKLLDTPAGAEAKEFFLNGILDLFIVGGGSVDSLGVVQEDYEILFVHLRQQDCYGFNKFGEGLYGDEIS